MVKDIKDAFGRILNLLYPLSCASCSDPVNPLNDYGVCGSCIERIRVNERSANKQPKKASYKETYSACLYEGVLKEIIRRYKYGKRPSLSKLCSSIMIEYAGKNEQILNGVDMVTFVPLHRGRLRTREYNQSKLLAKELSNRFNLPMESVLRKVKPTKYQNELKRSERLTNLRGAFEVSRGDRISGKRVLLIDDVITTGATLDECSRALLEGGAREIRCFTLAKGA